MAKYEKLETVLEKGRFGMGTRNLTVVHIDGEYKIAQYGQWDGYPEGQGKTVLTFLRDKMDLERFKTALSKCSYIARQEYDDLRKQLGTTKQVDAMWKAYPQFSRDTGAEILEIVQNHPNGIKLCDELSFAADSLFCEWAWVVDFDAGTFEGFEGFNKTPLTEEDRFYFLRGYEEGDYHGVRLVAKWGLDALPTDEEFLAAFEKEEDEE